ncbi:MAG: RlmE family RNA methyltransferase, partial [Pseudomonadota bacterium]
MSQIRTTKVRVKSARGRKTSSTRWLQRQLNDPFVAQAKAEGYRSRAVYKLIELDQKFKLLKPGLKVLDLGAAPGSWTEYVVSKKCQVTAIDLLTMDLLDGVKIIEGDFTDPSIFTDITTTDGGQMFDLILSDMAPNTTGHHNTDHLRIMMLCEEVFAFAEQHLKLGGSVLIKIFQGGTETELLNKIKKQ